MTEWGRNRPPPGSNTPEEERGMAREIRQTAEIAAAAAAAAQIHEAAELNDMRRADEDGEPGGAVEGPQDDDEDGED